MTISFTLTKDFEAAEVVFRADMVRMQGFLKTSAGRAFLGNVPVYDPEEWSESEEFNCYNLARHVRNVDMLQPGHLSIAPGPEPLPPETSESFAYALNIHERLLSDGLCYLGHSLERFEGQGQIASLFFNPEHPKIRNNHHLIGLKRPAPSLKTDMELVFVQTQAYWDAEHQLCPEETIFDMARSFGCSEFGGHYVIPHALVKKFE